MGLAIFGIIGCALILLYVFFAKPRKRYEEDDGETTLYNASVKNADHTPEDVFECLEENDLEDAFMNEDVADSNSENTPEETRGDEPEDYFPYGDITDFSPESVFEYLRGN